MQGEIVSLSLINNYFLIFLISKALVFTALLLFPKKTQRPQLILSLYLFTYAVCHLIILLLKNHLHDLPYIENLIVIYYLAFAFSPVLFYYYVLSINGEKLKKSYQALSLIIPLFVFIILLICFIPLSTIEKKLIVSATFIEESEIKNSFWIILAEILILAQVFIYVILIYLKIKQNKKLIDEHYSYSEKISLKWVFYLFYILFASYFFYILFGNFKMFYFDNTTQSIYLTSQIVITFIIGVFGLRQEALDISPIDEDNSNNEGIIFENKEDIIKNLEVLMIDEKIFLDNSLKIDQLAKRLNTNRYYLSVIIKEISGLNFCNYINKYRVDEFINNFESSTNQNLSIEGIANNVGFKSKSSFYSAFKKFHSCTPIQYMIVRENGVQQ